MVANIARVNVASGSNVVSLVPDTIPLSRTMLTASQNRSVGAMSVNLSAAFMDADGFAVGSGVEVGFDEDEPLCEPPEEVTLTSAVTIVP